MMKTKIIDMIPSNLRNDITIQAICKVLQPYLEENIKLTRLLLLYENIDIFPEEIVNHLAYQMHVDFYEEDLSLDTKRMLVKNSIRYHKYKGTPWAVEDLLSNIFSESWIEEWFEYEGAPYFFKVFTTDRVGSLKRYEDFFKTLFTAKNTRSWLEKFVVVRENRINIYAGATNRNLKKYKYYPYRLGKQIIKSDIRTGAYRRSRKKNKYGISKPRDLRVSTTVTTGVYMRRIIRRRYDFNRDGLNSFLVERGNEA